MTFQTTRLCAGYRSLYLVMMRHLFEPETTRKVMKWARFESDKRKWLSTTDPKKLTSNYNRGICVIVNTHGSIWDWAKFGAAEGGGDMQGWCWDDRNVTPSRHWGRKKGFIPPRQVRGGKNKKKWIIVSNWVFLSTSYRNAVIPAGTWPWLVLGNGQNVSIPYDEMRRSVHTTYQVNVDLRVTERSSSYCACGSHFPRIQSSRQVEQ